MSDQGLRAALESLAEAWKYERGDLYHASRRLMGLLEAYPAEPTCEPPQALTMDERFAFERAWDKRYAEGRERMARDDVKPEDRS